MKKVLLAGTAMIGLVALSNAASAELKLDLGGFNRGYAIWADNDEPTGTSLRQFDFRRDTEIHINGETTLDNGLTVGFHTEQDLGGDTVTDEAYGYFSGGWGRINLGSEDGAAYLLQVAAPSADSNVDGLRANINATAAFDAGTTGPNILSLIPDDATGDGNGLDYAHSDFIDTERFTYLTPKFNGFQAGVSYAPENGQNAVGNNLAPMATDNDAPLFDGAGVTTAQAQYEDLWELAARWDGEFSGIGLSLGAGYSNSDLEAETPFTNGAAAAGQVGDLGLTDGLETWNVGANIAWNTFSLGGGYKETQTEYNANVDTANAVAGANNVSGDIDVKTWIIGAAWDNGPYHVGASYLDQKADLDALSDGTPADDVAATTYEADRFTIGGGYTFGPGMTFRGSLAFGEYDNPGAATDNDFTQVAIGTDIQF